MLILARRPGLLGLMLAVGVGLAACGPANERPVSGAVPGSKIAATPLGVPPTLSPSDALRFHALPTPSPGLPAAIARPSPVPPVPSPVAEPSAVAAPPIVRTIAPSNNGRVAAGAVTLSAVLIGRGADLASASMTLNGVETGAQIDKRSAREWSIHASQTLPQGTHAARVLVQDSTGARGGFTWQFSVGDDPASVAPPDH